MRPSTIVLAVLTILSAAATATFGILAAPNGGRAVVEVLRLGGIVTIALGGACVIVTANHRRRQRLGRESDAHPGTVFIDAHATSTTGAELASWSPGLVVHFPCDLGFDRTGVTAYPRGGREAGTRIAARTEITGFDVFDQPTPLGSTNRWGIAMQLGPRDAGPVVVHVWAVDGQPYQDEYAMRRTIARICAALG